MKKSFDKKGNYIPGKRIPEMIDEKYYTPIIEEFHVGFEFEAQENNIDPKGLKWSKFDGIEPPDIEIIINKFKIHPECFRVKYLDKEDIESLGFKPKPDNSCTWTKEYIDPRQIDNIVDLIYNNHVNHLLICLGSSETCYSNWKTIFTGFIKNKSELKILLKQLNILT